MFSSDKLATHARDRWSKVNNKSLPICLFGSSTIREVPVANTVVKASLVEDSNFYPLFYLFLYLYCSGSVILYHFSCKDWCYGPVDQ